MQLLDIYKKVAALTEYPVSLSQTDMAITVELPSRISDSAVESLQWKIRRELLGESFNVIECRAFGPYAVEKVWLEIKAAKYARSGARHEGKIS